MPLNIIGDGEHARVVRDAARMLWDVDWPEDLGQHVAFVGKPGTTHRREYIEKCPAGTKFCVIAHPTAFISRWAKVGAGCFIGAHSVIQAGAVLGEHCVISTGAIVEHDCILGVGVHMAPRSVLGGGVQVGAWAWIGLGACVRDHITIGESAIVAMGAVVVKDVPSGVTVMGVPAK